MATKFLFESPDLDSAFDRLTSWAKSAHYRISGDASGGRFVREKVEGRLSDLEVLFFPEITGEYSIRKSEVALITDQDVPARFFANELAAAGFLHIRSL